MEGRAIERAPADYLRLSRAWVSADAAAVFAAADDFGLRRTELAAEAARAEVDSLRFAIVFIALIKSLA